MSIYPCNECKHEKETPWTTVYDDDRGREVTTHLCNACHNTVIGEGSQHGHKYRDIKTRLN